LVIKRFVCDSCASRRISGARWVGPVTSRVPACRREDRRRSAPPQRSTPRLSRGAGGRHRGARRACCQALVELDARAGSIRELLLETLEDDEDMRGMLLSNPGRHTDESDPAYEEHANRDEAEGLLEYYLQRCEACHRCAAAAAAASTIERERPDRQCALTTSVDIGKTVCRRREATNAKAPKRACYV
jgi:hypothetical protein